MFSPAILTKYVSTVFKKNNIAPICSHPCYELIKVQDGKRIHPEQNRNTVFYPKTEYGLTEGLKELKNAQVVA